jgi:hypothetical protein
MHVSQNKPEPLLPPQDIRVADHEIAEYRNSIREATFANALPPMDQSRFMTAREVSARQGQFFRLMGPSTRQYDNEDRIEYLRTVMALMIDAGQLADYGLVEGSEIKEFEVTVNSLMNQGLEIDRVENELGILERFAMFDQALLSQIDVPGWIGSWLKKLEFPTEYLKDVGKEIDQNALGDQAKALMGLMGGDFQRGNVK